MVAEAPRKLAGGRVVVSKEINKNKNHRSAEAAHPAPPMQLATAMARQLRLGSGLWYKIWGSALRA